MTPTPSTGSHPIPHDETAEQCILGGILLDNRLMASAAESVEPDDFYMPFHKRVYEAMLELFSKGEKIDPILINQAVSGSFSNVGGVARILALTDGLPQFDDIDRYVRIVADKTRLRALIKLCSATANAALAGEEKTDTIIERAEQAIFSLASVQMEDKAIRVDELYTEALAKTERMITEGIDAGGIRSGLTDLDRITGGWKNGDLVILAARPSMGKTAAAIQFAQHGISGDSVGIIFSLEMSKEQLMTRMISSETRMNISGYASGTFLKDYFEKAKGVWPKFRDKNLYIDNPAKASPMQILAKCRRLHARHKRLDMVVVDYLQLLSASGKTNSRYDAVSEISRELKQIAVELNVPVIALSQLSRAPEARNPPTPKLADLRESGSIEQDADVVVFIYREDYYKPNDVNFCEADFIVAKHRNGPCGTAKAQFWKSFTRFENLSKEGYGASRADEEI